MSRAQGIKLWIIGKKTLLEKSLKMKTDLQKRTGECFSCGTTWVVSHLPVPTKCPECVSLEADASLWGYLALTLECLGDNNLKARQIYNYVTRNRARKLGELGGKARAQKLTPQRRLEISKKANYAKKAKKLLPS